MIAEKRKSFFFFFSIKHLSPGKEIQEAEEVMAYEGYMLADMSDCHA